MHVSWCEPCLSSEQHLGLTTTEIERLVAAYRGEPQSPSSDFKFCLCPAGGLGLSEFLNPEESICKTGKILADRMLVKLKLPGTRKVPDT